MLVLTLAVCHRLLFTNLILARGDTFFYFYPYWQYRAEALRQFRLPLWNPHLFMGAPFLANIQAGIFYPPNWLLAPFDAPLAVKLAIALHVFMALAGVWVLARSALRLDPLPAFAAAIAFGLAGHFLAKAEQINQFQALAWLPWQLALLHALSHRPSNQPAWLPHRPTLAALALTIALQLLAGHTQTTFISIVALGLWTLASLPPRRWPVPLIWLGLAGTLAGGLTAVQLLPTAELSSLSFRSGGLTFNEAISFSFNPLLLGRALLPTISRPLFTEYIAYLGLTGLALLALALRAPRALWSQPAARAALILTLVGLLLALGGYNPFYWLLVRYAPGFDLFRVPARWLALFALGAALLIGHALQSLSAAPPKSRYHLALPVTVSLPILALAYAAAPLTPAGELGPLGWPTLLDLAVWLMPLALALALIYVRQPTALAALLAVELFLASDRLPLNQLTTPDAWYSVRPAMTQLLAAAADRTPPDRFLSMSALQFDPGDLPELRALWEPQFAPDVVFNTIVATKAREVLSPNLPLAWDIPSVDGYDGGILPTRAYAEFTQAFTGADQPSPDGRLREYLTLTPANHLLNLTNTRWLIADKVGDQWIDNIFYDLQFATALTPGDTVTVGYLPNFTATALGLVVDSSAAPDTVLATVNLTFANGTTLALPLTPADARLRWDMLAIPTALTLTAETPFTLRGLSLIDERSAAFHTLTPGPYRLAHSGDVKIYENLAVWPRAFTVASLPLTTASQPQPVEIVTYTPERIILRADLTTPGHLILLDPAYPGWHALVDGQPTTIETTNGLFRTVPLSAGVHDIVFQLRPASLRLGALITALAALITIIVAVWPSATKPNPTAPRNSL